MTYSTQQSLREEFETALGIISQASVAILALLDIRVAEGKDPQWFSQQLEQARQNLGSWAVVGRKLNLDDVEMSRFSLRLRHLQQLVPRYESGQAISQNQLFAALRFVACLERLRDNQPKLEYSTVLAADNDAQQRQALQQLRALELTLKGLIANAWPDQQQLINHLKQRIGGDKVRRWLKLGKQGDLLSGMLFSELALLVIDKKEYAQHYERLFNAADSLTLFVEPRKTLQTFLDDVRVIRNAAVQQQPLTSAQMTMLDAFYSAIAGPVQEAYAKGRVSVNPQAFMSMDTAKLDAFFEEAAQKNRAVGGDIFDLRDTIERPGAQRQGAERDTQQLLVSVLWGVTGVAFIAVALGALYLASDRVNPPQTAQSVNHASSQAVEISQPVNINETPREKLSRKGIRWDVNHFRAAIDRNETDVVQLFLDGGMSWQVAWTEQALAAKQDDSLNLLLRHRAQMDEIKPCRRMIATLSHALAQGETFTSMRKQFLKSFCVTPGVVKRQQHALDQAELRARANPDANTKKWAAIQRSIYQEISSGA